MHTEPADTVTHATVANHLSVAVSELPDYLSHNRNVSGVTGKQSSNDSHNNYDANDTISTGNHTDWNTMGPENRKKVNDELSRIGSGKGKNNPVKSYHKNSANISNHISHC